MADKKKKGQSHWITLQKGNEWDLYQPKEVYFARMICILYPVVSINGHEILIWVEIWFY